MKEINKLINDWLDIKTEENGRVRRRTVTQLSQLTGVSKQLIGHHLRNPNKPWTGPKVEPILKYLDEDQSFYEYAGPFSRGAVFKDAVM